LIPKQTKENGIQPEQVTFPDDGVLHLIHHYTREAGLRNLEREIGSICRKVARGITEGKTEPIVATTEKIRELLGAERFFSEVAERTDEPGVATGLVWTPMGGDIIFIEATKMSGQKGLTLTGHLGDVMKESAQAALSHIRSRARQLGIPDDFFDKLDIHVHVPAGAVPKDGPSAGVTLATALASLLTGRTIRHDVAMTGEITLRGRVLPVGGVKEKVLGAHRAGIKTVILPKRNEKDLEDVPEPIRNEMQFVFVDKIDEVFEKALSPAETSSQPLRAASSQA
jgi:ATP-dependent Lon protease